MLVDSVIQEQSENKEIKYYSSGGVFNAEFNDSVKESGVDFIYTWGVLEHIDDVQGVLRKTTSYLTMGE